MRTQIKQLLYGILATSCFGLSCTSLNLGLRKEAHNQIDNWETQQEQLKAKKNRLAEAKRKAEEERKKQKKLAALRKKADSGP